MGTLRKRRIARNPKRGAFGGGEGQEPVATGADPIGRRAFLQTAAVAAATIAVGPALAAGAPADAGKPAHPGAGASSAGESASAKPPAGPAPAAPAAAAGPSQAPASVSGGTAKVVLVRDEAVIDAAGKVRPEVVQKMLDDGICELLGAKSPAEAWKRLLGAARPVGIKTNVWKNLATPPEVEAAIRKRIEEAGVPGSELRIDDRGARTTLAPCAALVNVRPLRTHNWAGIGGCLKNPIMFSEEPSVYHPDMCADLGALWTLPTLKGKVRLNILVALTPQFLTRGPHFFDTRYLWPYKGIFLSTDPVAVDTLGVKLLEAKRRVFFGEDRPMTELAKHVRIAGEKHGIGVGDLSRIQVAKLGWGADILV
jgi:hypothetical protein